MEDIIPVYKLTAVTLIFQFRQAFQDITHEKLNLMVRYGRNKLQRICSIL